MTVNKKDLQRNRIIGLAFVAVLHYSLPCFKIASLFFARRGRSASLRQGRASARLGGRAVIAISQNTASGMSNFRRSLFTVHSLTSLYRF